MTTHFNKNLIELKATVIDEYSLISPTVRLDSLNHPCNKYLGESVIRSDVWCDFGLIIRIFLKKDYLYL